MANRPDPTVTVIIPDLARRHDGRWYLDTKTTTGLTEVYRAWSSPVHVVARASDRILPPGPNFSEASFHRTPITLTITENVIQTVARIGSDI